IASARWQPRGISPLPSCGRSLTRLATTWPCQWKPVPLLTALCDHGVWSAVSPATHGSCCNSRTGGGYPRWQDAICSAGSSIFFSSWARERDTLAFAPSGATASAQGEALPAGRGSEGRGKRIRDVEVVGVTTLVTGATGFIGANVVRALLEAGTSVRVLTRPGSDTHNLT